MEIGSLLNPPEEATAAIPIAHHAIPPAMPILSSGPRCKPGHHYLGQSCACSGCEAGHIQKSHGSHNMQCQRDVEAWPSAIHVPGQTWLPSNILSASFQISKGRNLQIQNGARRSPRQKYTEEEMFFIWYYRVDLGFNWRVVLGCFNQQFPERPRSGFHGIQRVLYRFIKHKRCPSFRNQNVILNRYVQSEHFSGRQIERASRFGVIACTTNVWYPWMRESRRDVLFLCHDMDSQLATESG